MGKRKGRIYIGNGRKEEGEKMEGMVGRRKGRRWREGWEREWEKMEGMVGRRK